MPFSYRRTNSTLIGVWSINGENDSENIASFCYNPPKGRVPDGLGDAVGRWQPRNGRAADPVGVLQR
jgi:hypothetical protein